MKLTEILNEQNQLLTAIIESEGEVLPDIEKALKLNANEKAQKIDSYDAVLRRLESEIELWQSEKKDIDHKIKVLKSAKDRIQASLQQAMEFHSLDRLEGLRKQFRLQEGPSKVDWKEEILPDERERFLRDFEMRSFVKTKRDLDKTELKKFLSSDKMGKQFEDKYFDVKKEKHLRAGLATRRLNSGKKD